VLCVLGTLPDARADRGRRLAHRSACGRVATCC
jgi:hypothetical protein